MSQLSLIIYSERPDFVATLKATFEGVESAKVVACATDLEEFQRLRKTKEADAVLIDLQPDPDYVLDEIERIGNLNAALFMIGPQHESQIILRAMRLGAREFFPDPPSAEVLEEAFRTGLANIPARPSGTKDARVVGVIGAKGGVGATTVACQLGFALQAMGQRTAIMDLNLPLGDVALHCDVAPAHTLANIAAERAKPDATLIRTLLQTHPSGLRVMASPLRIEEAETITVQHIGTALGLMREEFDWIILDVSRSWNEVSIHALDLSDLIVAVTVIDLPALGHLKQHLSLMERLGHTSDHVRLVANRFSKGANSLDEKDFNDFIGRDLDFVISNDYPTIAASIDAGDATSKVSSRSPVTAEFKSLAREIHGWCGRESNVSQAEKPLKGLRKLFRR